MLEGEGRERMVVGGQGWNWEKMEREMGLQSGAIAVVVVNICFDSAR